VLLDNSRSRDKALLVATTTEEPCVVDFKDESQPLSLIECEMTVVSGEPVSQSDNIFKIILTPPWYSREYNTSYEL